MQVMIRLPPSFYSGMWESGLFQGVQWDMWCPTLHGLTIIFHEFTKPEHHDLDTHI